MRQGIDRSNNFEYYFIGFKDFCFNQVHDWTCQRYTSARPLPLSDAWGSQHFEIMNLLNAFCESNKEG